MIVVCLPTGHRSLDGLPTLVIPPPKCQPPPSPNWGGGASPSDPPPQPQFQRHAKKTFRCFLCQVTPPPPPFWGMEGGGGVGTRPWWLALMPRGGACWPVALEPYAMTSGHPHDRGDAPIGGGGGNVATAHSSMKRRAA